MTSKKRSDAPKKKYANEEEELQALSRKNRHELTSSESNRLRELRTARIEQYRETDPKRYWEARSSIDGIDYNSNGNTIREEDRAPRWNEFKPATIRDPSKECRHIEDVRVATYKTGWR